MAVKGFRWCPPNNIRFGSSAVSKVGVCIACRPQLCLGVLKMPGIPFHLPCFFVAPVPLYKKELGMFREVSTSLARAFCRSTCLQHLSASYPVYEATCYLETVS